MRGDRQRQRDRQRDGHADYTNTTLYRNDSANRLFWLKPFSHFIKIMSTGGQSHKTVPMLKPTVLEDKAEVRQSGFEPWTACLPAAKHRLTTGTHQLTMGKQHNGCQTKARVLCYCYNNNNKNGNCKAPNLRLKVLNKHSSV